MYCLLLYRFFKDEHIGQIAQILDISNFFFKMLKDKSSYVIMAQKNYFLKFDTLNLQLMGIFTLKLWLDVLEQNI